MKYLLNNSQTHAQMIANETKSSTQNSVAFRHGLSLVQSCGENLDKQQSHKQPLKKAIPD